MKIARCSPRTGGEARWAAVDLDAGSVRPIAGTFREWAPPLTRTPGSEPRWDGAPVALEDVRLHAPVERSSKVLCAGANYVKHVDRLGLSMPERPAVFVKPYDAVIGPGDEIAHPSITSQLDYEVELVAVVGDDHTGERGAPDPSVVLGFTVGNDVSARDLQFGGVTGMDMFSAKGLDATSGVGPWIVTADEVGGASPDLEMRLEVDGETRQRDRTSSMVWDVPALMRYVDARSRLRAGDLLFTGTPAGVAYEDGRYLQPGQEVVASIEGIGELRNVVAART